MESCNLKQAVAERLKQARAALGMTQKAWCLASGMPLPSLKNYEGAKQIPGGEAVSAYVRAGISANWLLTGEGEMLRTMGGVGGVGVGSGGGGPVGAAPQEKSAIVKTPIPGDPLGMSTLNPSHEFSARAALAVSRAAYLQETSTSERVQLAENLFALTLSSTAGDGEWMTRLLRSDAALDAALRFLYEMDLCRPDAMSDTPQK